MHFSIQSNPESTKLEISDPVQFKSAWTGLDYESGGLIQTITYSVSLTLNTHWTVKTSATGAEELAEDRSLTLTEHKTLDQKETFYENIGMNGVFLTSF